MFFFQASIIGIVYLAGYMQWSVGWFVGPLVLSVIREQWKKSSDRRRNAAKTAALASEKDVVLARLNDLPAWVSTLLENNFVYVLRPISVGPIE